MFNLSPRPLGRFPFCQSFRFNQLKCNFFGGGRGGSEQGCGTPGEMGREVYGRPEKRGRDAGYLKGAGAGKNGENFSTLAQYFAIEKVGGGQSRYGKGAGTGSAGCGRRDVQTPLSPHVTVPSESNGNFGNFPEQTATTFGGNPLQFTSNRLERKLSIYTN